MQVLDIRTILIIAPAFMVIGVMMGIVMSLLNAAFGNPDKLADRTKLAKIMKIRCISLGVDWFFGYIALIGIAATDAGISCVHIPIMNAKNVPVDSCIHPVLLQGNPLGYVYCGISLIVLSVSVYTGYFLINQIRHPISEVGPA
jgi:hypothetical protein